MVLLVEQNRVLNEASVPRHPWLVGAMAQLQPLHDLVSKQTGRARFPRQLVTRTRGEGGGGGGGGGGARPALVGRRDDGAEVERKEGGAGEGDREGDGEEQRVEEAVSEMEEVLGKSISSIISLYEIRGHCIAGRDLVSGEVLTKETKTSYLKTVPDKVSHNQSWVAGAWARARGGDWDVWVWLCVWGEGTVGRVGVFTRGLRAWARARYLDNGGAETRKRSQRL